jgi:hypothetical protein
MKGARGGNARIHDVGDVASGILRQSIVILNGHQTILGSVHAYNNTQTKLEMSIRLIIARTDVVDSSARHQFQQSIAHNEAGT